MMVKIRKVDILRYNHYTKRKIYIKNKKRKNTKISFGEIFTNVQELKEKGDISIESVTASISKAVMKMK